MQYHPDRNPGNVEAESKFRDIAEAYESIGDAHKRMAYDQRRQNPGVDFGGFDANFNPMDPFSFFTGRQRGQPAREQFDVIIDTTLTFDEAVRGCVKEIKIEKSEPCRTCNGQGATEFTQCSLCNGTGRRNMKNGNMPFNFVSLCDLCSGTGKKPTKTCTDCGGSKIKPLPDQTLSINFPSGIDNGHSIRVSGQGNSIPNNNGNADLFIRVHVRSHEYFVRDGDNLVIFVPVDYSQLVLGDKIAVPSLDGILTLEIPPGTKPDSPFNMWGKGVPNLHTKSPGDLVAVIKLEVPEKINPEYKELFTKLREAESNNIGEQKTNYREWIKSLSPTE